MAYRSTGLRVMEDEQGQLLIVDSGWKTGVAMSFTLTKTMLERAAVSGREAAMMFRQFSRFILTHRDARKTKAQAKQESGTQEA